MFLQATRCPHSQVRKLVKLFNMAAFEDTFSAWSEISLPVRKKEQPFNCYFDHLTRLCCGFFVFFSVSIFTKMKEKNESAMMRWSMWTNVFVFLRQIDKRDLSILIGIFVPFNFDLWWEMCNTELTTLPAEFSSRQKNWLVLIMKVSSSTGRSRTNTSIGLNHN